MSHRMTSGGGRRRGLRLRSSISPSGRSARRSEARKSTRGPRRAGAVAAGAALRHRQAQPRDGAQRLVDLGLGHLLEIALLQHLAVGHGEGRLDLDFGRLVLVLRRLALPGLQRVLQAAAELLALSGLGRHADLRQQHLHHLFEQPRIAPIDVERLVEDLALVAPVHEHRVQRPVEVVALAEARRLDRLDGAQHLARPDRAGRPRARCGRNARCWWRACRARGSGPAVGSGQRVHRQLSPAAGRRCRPSPCAGSRPLRSPAGAGCRPGTSAARPACR